MVSESGPYSPVPSVASAVRIAIIIASTGRPESLAQWAPRIAAQTRAPDAFVYSVASEADLPGKDQRVPGSIVVMGPKGAASQRNTGIEAIASQVDVIAFFDDDYVPTNGVVAGLGRLFGEHPEMISANGFLLADGINSPGISYEDAMALITRWESEDHSTYRMTEHEGGLYGCNMAFRVSAIGDDRFDEQLPLYAWQEDNDFGARLIGRGRTVKCDAFVGVHQGSKGARGSGLRLGYSQVVNPLYLVRKGSMGWSYALKLIMGQMAKNHLKAFSPEPWVDRRGRARGNRRALFDVMIGKDHPGRILEM